MIVSGKRIPLVLLCVIMLTAILAPLLINKKAYAAQITTRSLTLQPGAGGDGGSMPSGEVNHNFAFTVPSVGNTNIGSILFTYCTTASGSCTAPTGLNIAPATLGNETGATGFSITNTAANISYLTRTAAAVTAGTALSYRFDDVINPSATNTTFYVRITTFTGTDGATGTVDTGTVAASTATQIVLTGTMPESLIFCTGATVSTTASIPDCSTATAGSISFNQLFSPTATATATSQMAASTNATSGYVITVRGPTMTSGGNTIPVIGGTATASTIGVGQFGLNLVDNTTPNVGINVAPATNGTNYKGEAQSNFDTDGSFAFVANANNTIAASNDGGAGPTDIQIFTASYIVNVSGSQTAGTYVSTLTYVCTATF